MEFQFIFTTKQLQLHMHYKKNIVDLETKIDALMLKIDALCKKMIP